MPQIAKFTQEPKEPAREPVAMDLDHARRTIHPKPFGLMGNMRAKLLMFAACLFSFSLMTASGEVFLYIDGLEGESQDSAHAGWIEISSFQQEHHVPKAGFTGAVTGGAVFEDIVITSRMDKASPKIAEAVARGTVFDEAFLEVARVNESNSVYLKYKLTNVTVSSYSLTVGAEVHNTFALSFEGIEVIYIPQDETGSPETEVSYQWNTQTGVADAADSEFAE